MGNTEIIQDRQKANTDPSRYRGKIKAAIKIKTMHV